jgi:hypothetical protein
MNKETVGCSDPATKTNLLSGEIELTQPGSKTRTGRPLSSSYAGVNSFE